MLSAGGSLFSLAVVTRALALPETQLYAHKLQCFLLRGESCTCTHLYIVLQADHGCVCVCACVYVEEGVSFGRSLAEIEARLLLHM